MSVCIYTGNVNVLCVASVCICFVLLVSASLMYQRHKLFGSPDGKLFVWTKLFVSNHGTRSTINSIEQIRATAGLGFDSDCLAELSQTSQIVADQVKLMDFNKEDGIPGLDNAREKVTRHDAS